MNIFVTYPCPIQSAKVLPDRHVVKMPLESCQMLSIVASERWGYNFGQLPKSSGGFYSTDTGAFRNHPCTKWAQFSSANWTWLISHGLALCAEYARRYDRIHSCFYTLKHALYIFPLGNMKEITPFARAMPSVFRANTNISTYEAYRRYLHSKVWPASNYLRIPERKPEWI